MVASLQQQQQQLSLPQVGHSVANGNDDMASRKRLRKGEYAPQVPKKFQTNMEISIQSEQPIIQTNDSDVNESYQNASTAPDSTANVVTILPNCNIKPNNENSPPKNVDCYIKRPKTCSLLDVCIEILILIQKKGSDNNVRNFIIQSYKNSWKSTHNHFQRYSDVKPREERRSTVVDLANQAHVLQKVNGWKIYHLTSQMEDLVIYFICLICVRSH